MKEDHSSPKFGLPEDYDIEDSSEDEDSESSAPVKAGEVQTWKPNHIATPQEAHRVRLALLALISVLWSLTIAALVITILVMAVLTRNPVWLAGELIPALLMKPFMHVLQHYFPQSEDRS